MIDTFATHRANFRRMKREEIVRYQTDKLRIMVIGLRDHPFYGPKLAHLMQHDRPHLLDKIPFTTKDELIPTDGSNWGRNHTYKPHVYQHLHRTSGTTGRPLLVADMPSDWKGWIETWQYVLDAADITERDVACLAFSFGPFIGFWSAYDALAARGVMVVPTGGMSSLARLQMMRESQTTVVCCTPSYALRLAEVAAENRFSLTDLGVRKIIVAGEPGGSLPAVRKQITDAWHADVVDHSGATEVGPWGYGERDGSGLRVIEEHFVAEFLPVDGDQKATLNYRDYVHQSAPLCELILTNLHRHGCPVVRYRTGDLVRPRWPEQGDDNFVMLEGGILGRRDDMLIIRGVNIFPSSIEEIVRQFPAIQEFRVVARKQGALDVLEVEVEDSGQGDAPRVAQQLEVQLGLHVPVKPVPQGSLPRGDGKARRFIDQRAG